MLGTIVAVALGYVVGAADTHDAIVMTARPAGETAKAFNWLVFTIMASASFVAASVVRAAGAIVVGQQRAALHIEQHQS